MTCLPINKALDGEGMVDAPEGVKLGMFSVTVQGGLIKRLAFSALEVIDGEIGRGGRLGANPLTMATIAERSRGFSALPSIYDCQCGGKRESKRLHSL